MSSPLSAALEKFRPKSKQVLVDEQVLVLRPLSVMAQSEFLKQMTQLDWAPVVARLQPVIEAVFALNLDDKAGRAAFVAEALPVLGREGPQLIAAVLGVALAPAAGILLDNQQNHRALCEAGILRPEDALMEGAVYLRSDALRAWVGASVTAIQAEQVLLTAVELNGWKDLAGKAWAVLQTRAGTAPKVNGTKPALETITG